MHTNTNVVTGTDFLDVEEIAYIQAHGTDWRITLKSGVSFLPSEELRHALVLKIGVPFPWHNPSQPST